MSDGKKSEKSWNKKTSGKRKMIPIETTDQTSEHVQLNSDVEVKPYVAEIEKEDAEDVKYSGKQAEIKQKFWDEVEMKHHGLVDSHAHHVEKAAVPAAQSKTKVPTLYEGKNMAAGTTFPTHVPYDEIAMKQSGFVDNHCRHMTESEIEHDDGSMDRRHVEIPASDKFVVTDEDSVAESPAWHPDNGSPQRQKLKEFKVDSKVDTVEIAVENEAQYKHLERQPMGAGMHLPWDELELKEHGLVDKQGHHKPLPEDEIQLHREGKIDEHGRIKSPESKRPSHLPFDELAMKRSGYLTDQCHHLTEKELNKPASPTGRDHVVVDSKVSMVSSTAEPAHPVPPIEFQQESSGAIPKRRLRVKCKRGKKTTGRSINVRIKGVLNIVETGSSNGTKKSQSEQQ